MITVKVDKNDINNVIKSFQATEIEAEKAVKFAIKETSAWAQSQTIKGVSALTKLPQKTIRKKTKAYYQFGMVARIYFNANPINLIAFRAKQNKYGITSRIKSIKSAFITEGSGKHGKYYAVFKRTGEFRRMSKGIYKGRMREAIAPIKEKMKPYFTPVVNKVSPQVSSVFLQKFNQKLSWQIGLR